MIYFTQDTQTKVIKIGYSKNPKKRRSGLQTASSNPLALLGEIPGGLEHEAEFHQRFAQYRLHGEWFKGDILSTVLAIIAQEAANPRPMMTNVIVAGDSERDFFMSSDPRQMAEKNSLELAVIRSLEEIHAKTPIAWVIIGGYRQIESFTQRWARQKKINICPYYPTWKRYGRGAPAKVGKQMLRTMFDPKVLLVFLGDKVSSNTQALIRQAEKAGIEVVKRERAAQSQ